MHVFKACLSYHVSVGGNAVQIVAALRYVCRKGGRWLRRGAAVVTDQQSPAGLESRQEPAARANRRDAVKGLLLCSEALK